MRTALLYLRKEPHKLDQPFHCNEKISYESLLGELEDLLNLKKKKKNTHPAKKPKKQKKTENKPQGPLRGADRENSKRNLRKT